MAEQNNDKAGAVKELTFCMQISARGRREPKVGECRAIPFPVDNVSLFMVVSPY